MTEQRRAFKTAKRAEVKARKDLKRAEVLSFLARQKL